MPVIIPSQLAASCRTRPERTAWIERLPDTLRYLKGHWSRTLGTPFEDATCAWAAAGELADGSATVLKLGMPHMEGEHEIQGLRFWIGDPTGRLLAADQERGAMLLERCEPGTPLSTLIPRAFDCGCSPAPPPNPAITGTVTAQ